MRRNASTQPGYDPQLIAEVIGRTLLDVPTPKRPWLIGLSGLQGSGKTTFAAQFARVARAHGLATLSISLDDFYFGRRERARIAHSVHPLLKTRGVPGTHDLDLLRLTLDALALADSRQPARVPRFDKGSDTRVVPSRWKQLEQRPDLVLLEGWCVGIAAQSSSALLEPVNSLEREEDSDRHWRTYVNDNLAGEYADLWARLDRLIVLQAPSFDVVARWRDQQEQALRKRHASRAMSVSNLSRFIQHYERLSRHALLSLPSCADILIALGEQREVLGITEASPDSERCGQTARY